MKIAVYAITRDEELFINRFMTACLPADEIVVCDTGSTDRTLEMLEGWAAKYPAKIRVHRITVAPWRFDMARNASLALVSADVDVACCIDLDEVLQPGWRESLESAWTPVTDRLRYRFHWSWNQDGTPAVSYMADKIHKRHGFIWRGPCHETMAYYGGDHEQQTFVSDGLTIHHHPDDTKPRSQYLPLLQMAVRENPYDDRASYYLGRELFFHGQWQDAFDELERHRSLESQAWHLERAASFRLSGKCQVNLGNAGWADHFFELAAETAPELRECWLDLAESNYRLNHWRECYDAAQKALAITVPPHDSHIIERHYYDGPLVHDLLAIACWHLGKMDEALDHARTCLKMEPANERFRGNLALIVTATTAGRS